MVESGYGRHIYYLTPNQIKQTIKMVWVLSPFAFLALFFGRVSFAVSLIILMGSNSWRRWLLWFIIVTQFLCMVVVAGLIMFGCNPVNKFWDRQLPGKCLGGWWLRGPGYVHGGKNFTTLRVSYSGIPLTRKIAFNIFGDLVLALMPAFVIAKLNLNRGAKAGIIFLMGLGLV